MGEKREDLTAAVEVAATAAEERNLENVREVAILAERTMEVGEDSETEVKRQLSVSLLEAFVSRVRYSKPGVRR